ncbi:MAG: HEAT repeat domain-containing protein [Asgard group archaeon]|nr:HEAT repeat domain-containing protein [Asgard group archaeon]
MDIKKIRDELKSRNKKSREEAVDQLALAQDPETIPDLIRVLEKDREGTVRRRAALALGRIDLKECADALYKAASNDSDEETRRNAAIALGNLGDERAIVPLYEFYTSPRKNTFSDNLDRARVNKVLIELCEKKAQKSIEELVEWRKKRIK